MRRGHVVWRYCSEHEHVEKGKCRLAYVHLEDDCEYVVVAPNYLAEAHAHELMEGKDA